MVIQLGHHLETLLKKNGAKIIFQVQKMRETLSKSNEIESISRERRSDLKKVFSSQEKMVSLMDQQVSIFYFLLKMGFKIAYGSAQPCWISNFGPGQYLNVRLLGNCYVLLGWVRKLLLLRGVWTKLYEATNWWYSH